MVVSTAAAVTAAAAVTVYRSSVLSKIEAMAGWLAYIGWSFVNEMCREYDLIIIISFVCFVALIRWSQQPSNTWTSVCFVMLKKVK